MDRTAALARMAAMLPRLSDEDVETLAEIAQRWTDEAGRRPEGQATRAAIAAGVAQAKGGEFASDEEVGRAYARFRE